MLQIVKFLDYEFPVSGDTDYTQTQLIDKELNELLLIIRLLGLKTEMIPTIIASTKKLSQISLNITPEDGRNFTLKMRFTNDGFLNETILCTEHISLKKIFKRKFQRSMVEATKVEKLVRPIRCTKETIIMI